MHVDTIEYVRHLTARDKKTLSQKGLKIFEEIGELARVVLPFEMAPGTTHRFALRSQLMEEACDIILTVASVVFDVGGNQTGIMEGSSSLPIYSLSDPCLSDLVSKIVGSSTLLLSDISDIQNPELDARDSVVSSIENNSKAVVETAYQLVSILGFTGEDLNSMFQHKLRKWATLQAAEDKVSFPLPFEIHVTVSNAEPVSFRRICQAIGVKPIILDLHLKSGGVARDMQTSSVFFGDNPGSVAEVERISSALRAEGLDVIREKIETVPWHPAAPTDRDPSRKMPKDCYFEAHLNVVCTDEQRELLAMISSNTSSHLSRNIFKRLPDGSYTIMVTYREYDGTYETFTSRVAGINRLLKTAGFVVDKEIVEFAIHDTLVSHDEGWLSRKAA